MCLEYILYLSCPDKPGIVAAVSGFLAAKGANILDSAQFGDCQSGKFFLRIHFADIEGKGKSSALRLQEYRTAFAPLALKFSMNRDVGDWHINQAGAKLNSMIMVSRHGHCLNHLLYRYRTGVLPINIQAIISNHLDYRGLAEWHAIPFHYIPITPTSKQQAEAQLRQLMIDNSTELLVLARYMQVLGQEFCRDYSGKIINIHHSFLPSFAGAKPYHRAHERGVKLIGATAHYVTEDLDEGPIIEQEVERVDHRMTPEQLAEIGKDIEAKVLAKAVTLHAEHRILLNNNRTVVFN
ncbi:MAG: formyltetrahydrofolate deformylase [Alphaproteobacteria bacterium]